MTLEIYVSDSEPTDSQTGTYLKNTVVLDCSSTHTYINRNATAWTGKPLSRWVGVKNPQLKFTLLIEEKAETGLDSSSLGLVDLDVLYQAAEGMSGSEKGLRVWIRDTEGSYLIRHWKGGRIKNINVKHVPNFANVIGSTLYKVTFTFETFYTSSSHHDLVRF